MGKIDVTSACFKARIHKWKRYQSVFMTSSTFFLNILYSINLDSFLYDSNKIIHMWKLYSPKMKEYIHSEHVQKICGVMFGISCQFYYDNVNYCDNQNRWQQQKQQNYRNVWHLIGMYALNYLNFSVNDILTPQMVWQYFALSHMLIHFKFRIQSGYYNTNEMKYKRKKHSGSKVGIRTRLWNLSKNK